MTMQKAVQLSGAELTRNDVFSAPYNGWFCIFFKKVKKIKII
jgi:hypothetical protein